MLLQLSLDILHLKRILLSFNTVNGKHYFLITFVLPSLRSGTCNVWASSSLRSSAASHSAAHTVNGKYYCFISFILPSLRSGTWDVQTSSTLRSSAVSHPSAHTVNGKCCCNEIRRKSWKQLSKSFNTVNGKCCCNLMTNDKTPTDVIMQFQYQNGKHCYFISFVLPSLRSGTWDVRTSSSLRSSAVAHPSAHTVNGRCCCKYIIQITQINEAIVEFQYRKR